MLFAHHFLQAKGPGGGPPAGPSEAFVIFLIASIVLFVAGLIAIKVLFLLNISRCLDEVHPDNRKMEPGLVWLAMIPCFDVIWYFFIVINTADSLRNEYEERGLYGDGDYGRSTGMTFAVMVVLGNIPYIGGLFGLVALVFFILYWVKIAGYRRELRETAFYEGDDAGIDRPSRQRRYQFDDDRDFDRPRTSPNGNDEDRSYREEQDDDRFRFHDDRDGR